MAIAGQWLCETCGELLTAASGLYGGIATAIANASWRLNEPGAEKWVIRLRNPGAGASNCEIRLHPVGLDAIGAITAPVFLQFTLGASVTIYVTLGYDAPVSAVAPFYSYPFAPPVVEIVVNTAGSAVLAAWEVDATVSSRE